MSTKRKSQEPCSECGNQPILLPNRLKWSPISEEIMLTDPKLGLFDEKCLYSEKERPQLKITNYFMCDSNNHLVSIEDGLIESGKDIYLYGYVKSIYDTNLTINNSIPTKNIGPINEWWIYGFDGGKELVIGLESNYCSYILMKPASYYNKIMNKLITKLHLTKYVIEYVTNNTDCNFEDLIGYIEEESNYTKDDLLNNIEFIMEQIMSYDEAAREDDVLLFETHCIQHLIQLSSVTNFKKSSSALFSSSQSSRVNIIDRNKIHQDSKATCTELVRSFFDNLFEEAINKCSKSKSSIKHKKQDSSIFTSSKANWIGNIKHIDQFTRRKYYESVKVNKQQMQLGDLVRIEKYSNEKLDGNHKIGFITSLFESCSKDMLVHLNWAIFSEDTILGEAGNSHCIYLIRECEDIHINFLRNKVNFFKKLPSTSSLASELLSPLSILQLDNSQDYLCDKFYSIKYGAFYDIDYNTWSYLENGQCPNCIFKDEDIKKLSIESIIHTSDNNANNTNNKIYINSICKNGILYEIDDFALINYNIDNLPDILVDDKLERLDDKYDDNLYPERYRKMFTEFIKGSNDDTQKPYNIIKINKIFKDTEDEEIIVEGNVFYRPQNFCETFEDVIKYDLNEIFYTDHIIQFNCDYLVDKCYAYFESDTSKENYDNFYIKKCFYFSKYFILDNKQFTSIPFHIQEKYKYNETNHNPSQKMMDLSSTKLRTMDLFSGCGGFSLGFHQAGIIDTCWAIEKDESIAKSFAANFPNAKVYNNDANKLLEKILNGENIDDNGIPLPKKGEVELILAGPPCQGFSGMNRFSSRQYSLFKNSLIVTFLSYVDHFKPKYVIFENVRNFALFKKSMIFKSTLSCLLEMGYQVQFSIVQAGSYGVPQSRRRIIIIATLSGLLCPSFPQPTHTFSLRATQLNLVINEKRYISPITSLYNYINDNDNICDNRFSGLYRSLTVLDAIGDLGDICNKEKYYETEANNYQRIMRNNCKKISLHYCKSVNPLTKARIERIPCYPGADWRDLPNVSIRLEDGSKIEKLLYNYNDCKNGYSESGKLRGVCSCANNEECNISISRQENTLIPWCLVHTANRQYQWSGLYGRLQWNGFFPTTVTNPEPISKQGTVIHPKYNRIISIRECARSQGFPDTYKFFGTIMEIHKQIGNAVPPLLALTIALEIKKILIYNNS